MLNNLIVNITQSFDALKIPYMIIGGQAVLLYGEPRLTKDIDITLGIGLERLDDIIKLSEKLGMSSLTEDLESFVKRTMVFPLTDKKSGIRVDLIFSFTEYEKKALDRAKRVIIDGSEVKFASVEDIIIHKIFAGRPRDIEDVKGIVLRNKDFDKKYVAKWLELFDVSEGSKGFSDSFKAILSELNLQ